MAMNTTNPIVRIQPAMPIGMAGEALGLTVGQIVRGTVLRSAPGLADLLVRGQVLQMRTDLSLVPGAQVNLQVREAAGQGLTLSLVPERPAPDSALAPVGLSRLVASDDLQELALALRLPASDRTVAILRELMANGRPLTAEAVRQVLIAGHAVGGDTAAPARPLVWLVANGLPVTPETMRLAMAALPDEAPLPAPALPGALPATRLPGQARAADAVLARLLTDLPSAAQAPVRGLRVALAQLGFAGPPAEPLAADGLTRRLVAIGESVATPIEAKLGRLLARPSPAASPVAEQPTATSGRTAPAQARPGDPGTEPTIVLPSPTEPTRPADLRLLVARTLNAVRQEAPDAPQAPAPAASSVAATHPTTGGRPAAIEALTTLAASLEFSQLANTVRPEVIDGRQTVWLPLPLPPGPNGQPPSLTVSRWEGQEGADQPRRLRATLNLSLQHLGDLTVNLDLAGRAIRCELRSSSASLEIIQPELAGLHDRLADLGYAVEAVAASAAPTARPPLTAPAPRRLDQRV